MNTNLKSYSIIKQLGQGGMATVYLAEHQMIRNKVAIKILNDDFVRNKNIRSRFIAEAKNMARMSHPNIIKVTDLVDDADMVAFVMEYIEGQTLKEYLDAKGKLTNEEIKILLVQMLDAVGYVHEQGLVHRDIKPSNFMISDKGVVKLLDFGIAKNTDVNSLEYTMTGTMQNMGTPMYMRPEQIKSTKDVTHQTDIYSLGVVLWQMVTGRKPYNSYELSLPEIQVSILKEDLPITNTKWDAIIKLAMEKSVDLRYLDCAKMNEDVLHAKDISTEFSKEEDLDQRSVVENMGSENRQKGNTESLNDKKEEGHNGVKIEEPLDYQTIVDVKVSPNPEVYNSQISSIKAGSNSGKGFNPIVFLFIGIVIVSIISYNRASSSSSEENIYSDSTEYTTSDDNNIQSKSLVFNNESPHDVSLAFAYYDNQNSSWRSVGWYSVKAGEFFQYSLPENYDTNYVYWYATNANNEKYEGNDASFCIDANAFDYYDGNYCDTKATFYKLDLSGNVTTHNLRP